MDWKHIFLEKKIQFPSKLYRSYLLVDEIELVVIIEKIKENDSA